MIIGVTTPLGHVSQTQRTLAELQRDLTFWTPSLLRIFPPFRSFFAPVLQMYDQPFLVDSLGTEAAFFADQNTRQLTFNSSAFEAFHRPINDAERDGLISVDDATTARHIATEKLALHEIVHVPQGIAQFGDIDPLKQLASSTTLAEFDLIADAHAAMLGAHLEMLRAGEKGWHFLAHRYLHQLFVIGEFAFKAFKAPISKPHKRQRFLGIAMMAAVARDALWSSKRPSRNQGALPLGTPLMPYFDAEGLMLIFAFDPDKKMWGSPRRVDPNLLISTCAGLDEAPFATSVEKAARILQQFGVLPVTSTNSLRRFQSQRSRHGR